MVRRLGAAGAVLMGKVNLNEFACGDPDPEGPLRNMQNPRKIGQGRVRMVVVVIVPLALELAPRIVQREEDSPGLH